MNLSWGRHGRSSRAAAALAVTALLGAGVGVSVLPDRASAAGAVTYSATQTIPVPPASTYEGSGGGDGWAVALSSTSVFNVFHHSSQLTVACHQQADATECWTPRTITDGSGDFTTSGHPGLWLDQTTARLYVYATRAADGTGGVVCIDTVAAAADPDPFCGFTALTGVGEAPTLSGISAISAPAQVGTRWYAFNYVLGSPATATRNSLLCFDLASHSACASQPFRVGLGASAVNDGDYPPPAVTAIGGRVIVPVTQDAGRQLICFDPSTSTTCAGSWPITLTDFYFNGAAFPLLTAAGVTIGLCLPTGEDPCWNLSGASVPTPAGMSAAVGGTSGWNGSAIVLGPRVYVPNGGSDEVDCYDAATSASCAHFPKAMPNLNLLYTLNPDPQRPTCIWVNADGGSGQIQNFDAFTGGACGRGPIRVLASSFVVASELCKPATYTSLQVTTPARGTYSSGSVAFQDGDAAPIPGAADRPVDAAGAVDLSGLNLSTATGLPHFLITLVGSSGAPSAVTVKLTWTGTDDPSCVKPGTVVSGGGSQADDCPDLFFLGAAGSGQHTARSNGYAGMGPQVYSSYIRLLRDLQGGYLRQIDGQQLQYSAASVSLLAHAPGVYFDSIASGVTLAEAKIHKVRRLCPQAHIVLAGYSQGAMVMHRVLQHLVAANDAATLAHLDGALLIADGDRVTGDRTTDWGNATPPGQGIGQFFPAISGSSSRKLPTSLQGRVHRVCNLLDPVCDDIVLLNPVTLAARIPIHTGYTNGKPLLDATDAVARQVRSTPAPANTLTKLTAKANRPYSARLTADVDRSHSLEWRLVPPAALPPGWFLSSHGLVTGTTSYVGTWTTRVEVRASVLGVTGEWIPATVTWTISR